MTGTMKWFNRGRNYGFITAEDGANVFVHLNELVDKVHFPKTGDVVSFEVVETAKGKAARNVAILGQL